MTGWADQILLLGVATARIAATFLLLPMFSSETVPALVRNSIFVALGIVSLAIQPTLTLSMLGPTDWAAMILKEVFVGLLMGFFFGSVLWALAAAGAIVDTAVGATMAQIVDPLTGHQTSLNGAFLGRLGSTVFMALGGLSLLLRVVMESYALWPIASPMPALDPRGLDLVAGEFGRLMLLATLFAAPVLVVLFLIDMGLGLMNRFAQQLNVFTLSMSIKSFAATFLILLLLGSYVGAIVRDIGSRPEVLLSIIRGMSTR